MMATGGSLTYIDFLREFEPRCFYKIYKNNEPQISENYILREFEPRCSYKIYKNSELKFPKKYNFLQEF